MLEQISSWLALSLHTELSPRRTFMEVRKCLFALWAIVMISYYVRSCKWY